MNKEQAAQTLKQVLDAAVKAGIFTRIEDTVTAYEAFKVLANPEKEESKS